MLPVCLLLLHDGLRVEAGVEQVLLLHGHLLLDLLLLLSKSIHGLLLAGEEVIDALVELLLDHGAQSGDQFLVLGFL